MPITSRRCGMITRREAERLCKSFLGDNSPPRLPKDFAFQVYHKCAWGCMGLFIPSRYNSSRAKCIKCQYCNIFFSPNKFIFHSHRMGSSEDKYVQPIAANFNSWRRHLLLAGKPTLEMAYMWEDVKAMFNGGTRKRHISSHSAGAINANRSAANVNSNNSNAMDSDEAALGSTKIVANKSLLSSASQVTEAFSNISETILPLWKASAAAANDTKPSDIYHQYTAQHRCSALNATTTEAAITETACIPDYSFMMNYMYQIDSNSNLFTKNPSSILANSQSIKNYYIQNNHITGTFPISMDETKVLTKSMSQIVSLSAFKPISNVQDYVNQSVIQIRRDSTSPISITPKPPAAHDSVASNIPGNYKMLPSEGPSVGENVMLLTEQNSKEDEDVVDVENSDDTPPMFVEKLYRNSSSNHHSPCLVENISADDSSSDDVFIDVVDENNEDEIPLGAKRGCWNEKTLTKKDLKLFYRLDFRTIPKAIEERK
ncbi:SKI family transcriptional corepressor fussel [Musca autumnalis]|uniref:SKI family transcriptional corepressor fussel n=1 Tax=Musca autumnalis TaxID=221902 RepID=UPI003CF23135